MQRLLNRAGVQVKLLVTVSPLLTLSLPQVSALLDEIIKSVQDAAGKSRDPSSAWMCSGWNKVVAALSKQVQTEYSSEHTNVYVTLDRSSLRASHEDVLLKELKSQISQLRRLIPEQQRNLDRLARDIGWLIDAQLKVARRIAELQQPYLTSRDCSLLVPLSIKDLAEQLGYHRSTVSRIARQLVILTGSNLHPARQLLPGDSGRRELQIREAVEKLGRNQGCFQGGWLILQARLAQIVSSEVGFFVSRRTVARVLRSRGEGRRRSAGNRKAIEKRSVTCETCGHIYPPMSLAQHSQASVAHEHSRRHINAVQERKAD